MSELKVGIAGLGVVGSGVFEILTEQAERLERAGAELHVSAVSAANRDKERGIALDGVRWVDDPVDLAQSDEIDIFVELIGGADGSALDAVTAAIENGKHVVTANKALLATHGVELARKAEHAGTALCYEAAVAGGIPIIRGLREGASACRIERIAGLLNGTCNYILTQMTSEGQSYDDALADAQALGYAEADPTFDVGGADAAQKLTILGNIAFDAAVEYGTFPVTGIEAITSQDIMGAGKLGYRIKLMAVAIKSDSGAELRVHPALVDAQHSLAKADGAENYVMVDCDPLGRLAFSGPGAGKGATAAAVVADLVTIARGPGGPVFNAAASRLAELQLLAPERQPSRFYIRLNLRDVPGAIAGVSETLAGHDISIDSLYQPAVSSSGGDGGAMVVLATHETSEVEVRAAVAEMQQKPFAMGTPSIIRIEDL